MHYKYKKEYYDKTLLNNEFSEANKDIIGHKYPENMVKIQEIFANDSKVSSFSLYTMYPGLLLGIGELHETGIKEEIQGGFSFDYVTGLPVIMGSTLKGMLRSYFESSNDEIKNQKQKMIRDKLGKNESFSVDNLMVDIFEHNDVFLGGYPICKDEEIFSLDYITPHVDQKTNKINLLKGPNVIKLLKVRPGIEFQFFFILNDYMVEDKESGKRITLVTKEEKKNLFKKLLLFGGIGAKTNVGFGQFGEKKDTTSQ